MFVLGCSVLRWGSVGCGVLQCLAVSRGALQCSVLQYVAVCCGVLQCVAVSRGVPRCIAVYQMAFASILLPVDCWRGDIYMVMQYVAVLQCVTVCRDVLQYTKEHLH